MWSRERDLNDDGTSVALLQPLKKSNNKSSKRRVPGDATVSFMGGSPIYFSKDDKLNNISLHPTCAVCRDPLFLLVQLHVPLDDGDDCDDNISSKEGTSNSTNRRLDRTLYVFGCNRASCANQSGTFRCLRSQHGSNGVTNNMEHCKDSNDIIKAANPTQSQRQPLVLDAWGDSTNLDLDDIDDNDNNDWGGDWGDDQPMTSTPATADQGEHVTDKSRDLHDLEAMLAKCEMKNKSTFSSRQSSTARSKSSHPQNNCSSSSNNNKNNNSNQPSTATYEFPRYELEWIDEPPKEDEDDPEHDEDNVGFHKGTNKNRNRKTADARIEKMLQRYLQEEEDVEVVTTLKNLIKSKPISSSGLNATSTSLDGCSANNTDMEDDDDSESQSMDLLLSFTNRMKRAPKQVVRYAYGGGPMWST